MRAKSVPKDVFVCPKRECVPQKKAIGPTPLGCICDKDLFVLFLVFTIECEGKIRTKGGFWAPKQKIVPQKKATKPMPLCSFFFWSSPRMWRQNPHQRRLLCPMQECASKAKIVPQMKATGPTPLRCICDKDLFFGLHPRLYVLAHSKFSMPPSSPAHYSGAGSASMNRSEIGLKIVFQEDHTITSLSTVCFGLGEDLFCLEITSFQKLLAKW